eukprot:gene10254-2673_t
MKLLLFFTFVFVQLVVSHSLNLNHLLQKPNSEITLRFYETKSCSGYTLNCKVGCCTVLGSYFAGAKTESIKTEILSSGARITRYSLPNCQATNGYFHFSLNQCYYQIMEVLCFTI